MITNKYLCCWRRFWRFCVTQLRLLDQCLTVSVNDNKQERLKYKNTVTSSASFEDYTTPKIWLFTLRF